MYSFIEILYISWSKGEQKKQYPFHPDEVVGEGTKGRCLVLNCIAGTSIDQGMFMRKFRGDLCHRRLVTPTGSPTYGNPPKTESFQVLRIINYSN